MRTELVAAALDMAIAARGGDVAGMVFHHDRGSAISVDGLPRRSATRHGIPQSVGASGRAQTTRWPNRSGRSSSESSSRRYRFATRAEARRAIIAWINHYNAVRLHSTLGYVPPIEWELRFARRHCKLHNHVSG